jgi:peptidoglycan hydrolase CwlO-like protein
MYKKILSVVLAITLMGVLIGDSKAEISTPFDYSTIGVEIVDFNLDFKDIEVILDIQVTEIPATIEISFEREFFDSVNSDKNNEFTIIADGDIVYYEEVFSNSEIRTLKFNLSSDTELVEIFGTHLKGISAQTQTKIISEEISTKEIDQTDKINELLDENKKLQEDNMILKEENKELDGRIFELQNLVSALETQVSNLNTIVTEQLNVIYNWVLGYAIS